MYKGKLFNRDKIVTGDDNEVIQYYLEFPSVMFSCTLKLRRGGKEGPVLCTIDKTGLWAPKQITMQSDGKAIQVRSIHKLGFSQEFQGWAFPDTTWQWTSHAWTGQWHVSSPKL